MALRLYNTLTKREEDFVPLAAPRVTMYTCGPTVYGRPHIGNYASFLMADLLRRWLEAGHNYEVVHVKNITDVGHLLHDADSGDDKIQREAEKAKLHPLEVAKRYTEEYLEDERALNFLEPAHRPRATEYVEQMKEMTQALLASGHAYVTDDGIYFDVTSKTPTPYGALSGNTLDAVKAGARVGVKEGKKHPADFALWKFCVGDNAHHVLRWPSPKIPNPNPNPTPDGFPGWHIECSAMSRALLGDTIDLHTGGEDNIFPHHECEIAQSESVTGTKPFVRTWLHRRRINLEGEKMSKSLGNVLSISNIVAKGYDPMDIRYYLLSVHYRTNLAFSEKGLDDARKARGRIINWMKSVETYVDAVGFFEDQIIAAQDGRPLSPEKADCYWKDRFTAAMDSDLNTSEALGVIFEAMNNWNKKNDLERTQVLGVISVIKLIQKTFGCFDYQVYDIDPDILEIAHQREAARKQKDFKKADELRDALKNAGYEVKDTDKGPELKKI
jgi:cysteinyl-tRNA synthetase